MRHPWRALVAWFRVPDEVFVERIRQSLATFDRWRRPLMVLYAGLTIAFVGILIATVRLFGGLAQQLGNVDVQSGAFGFFLGLSLGAMLFFLAVQIGQGLMNLLFGFRSERLMIRYYDALRERESKPGGDEESESPGAWTEEFWNEV